MGLWSTGLSGGSEERVDAGASASAIARINRDVPRTDRRFTNAVGPDTECSSIMRLSPGHGSEFGFVAVKAGSEWAGFKLSQVRSDG